MGEIFADTFYWIALANPADQGHQAASGLQSGEFGHAIGYNRVLQDSLLDCLAFARLGHSGRVYVCRARIRVSRSGRSCWMICQMISRSRPK